MLSHAKCQVRSAKPLCAGSIPTCASNLFKQLTRIPFKLPLSAEGATLSLP
jgi:hypothetical protein